jgi:hypothetical protein
MGNAPHIDPLTLDPMPETGGIRSDSSCLFDILDSYDLLPGTFEFYVNGSQAYGGNAWIAPYDGYVGRVSIDGYDGYHVRIDRPTLPASSRVDIRVVAADSQAGLLDQTYGFWIAPTAFSPVVDPYEITLRLVFSGAMDPVTILDASLFRISGGAYARKVDILSQSELRLWVEGLTGEEPFTMTVSSLVADIHGGHPAGDIVLPVPVFQSDALFPLRSWHVSQVALQDAQRAYFAGYRGVDVLDIRFGMAASNRWAQVLDAYGVVAMCLSGDGYDFSVGVPPILADLDPPPYAVGVPTGTGIRFSVVGETTSVEMSSLAIYVDTVLAFGGIGGWVGNWGGQITVRHQGFDVELLPPEPFAPDSRVVVRVVVSDLLGTSSDTTYSFTTA